MLPTARHRCDISSRRAVLPGRNDAKIGPTNLLHASVYYKSDTVLPTARHRCDISSKRAVLPGRNDAKIGPTNLLHASVYYKTNQQVQKFYMCVRVFYTHMRIFYVYVEIRMFAVNCL